MPVTVREAAPGSTLLRGDPRAIRDSASDWLAMAHWCSGRAEDVRACRATGFDGDEGHEFNATVERYGRDLNAAAMAWRAGGVALSRYAELLAQCQARLARTRSAGVLAEHDQAVRQCRRGLDAARTLLARIRADRATATSGIGPLTGGTLRRVARLHRRSMARSRPAPSTTAGLRSVGAGLKSVSGRAALFAASPAMPHRSGVDEFFGELGELLGVAAMALAVVGGGGGGATLAAAGGAGAVAASPVAAPASAIAGAAVAGAALGILIASIVEGEPPEQEIVDALSGNRIAGTPEINMHDLAELNRSTIPPDVLKEVDDAIARAKVGKERFPGHDGSTWHDKLHQLPPAPEGYYTEWTASPNGAGRGWDHPDRVIIGGSVKHPDAVYYWDHTDAAPVCVGP